MAKSSWVVAVTIGLVEYVKACNKVDIVDVTKQFPEKYPKLFGPGPGLYNKEMLKLVL